MEYIIQGRGKGIEATGEDRLPEMVFLIAYNYLYHIILVIMVCGVISAMFKTVMMPFEK